jgi:hypothetical protein
MFTISYHLSGIFIIIEKPIKLRLHISVQFTGQWYHHIVGVKLFAEDDQQLSVAHCDIHVCLEHKKKDVTSEHVK